MKALIIYASPRGRTAGSSRIAAAFTEGLTAGGAETTDIVLREKNVKHCTGCYSCWTKTPGVCVLKDDMHELLAQIRDSDLTVYAMPLYYFTLPGLLKDFFDRQLPLFHPALVPLDGRTVHKERSSKQRSWALIATAGFPEPSAFDALVHTFDMIFPEAEARSAGSILVSGAEPLYLDTAPGSFQELFSIVRTAGRETAVNGRISEDTLQALSAYQETRIGNTLQYNSGANQYWESQQLPGENTVPPVHKAPPSGKALRLSAGGMETLMAGMALSYRPEARPGLEAVMQFDFIDEQFYLYIRQGQCSAYRGRHPQGDFTVRCPAVIWEAVAEGSMSGVDGFMQGKYTVEGDMQLFLGMNELFSSTSGSSDSAQTPPVSGHTLDKAAPDDTAPQRRGVSGGMQMSIAFIPWMIAWISPSFVRDRVTAIMMFSVAALIYGYFRLTRKGVTLFEAGTLGFAVFQLVFAFFPVAFFTRHLPFFQYLYLSFLWTASFTRPFCLTAEYSRLDFPRSIWNIPSFTDTNRILTALWSLYYCAAAGMEILSLHGPSSTFLHYFPYLFIPPLMVFTVWFQRWYPRHLLRPRTT
ncbi:MAG: NAD(P)H-dependent oxidoreductase [Spirochaetales bacterium]|nr:NAD(P)H-dependent oxidoreductase [Spirochaetales bacterium]